MKNIIITGGAGFIGSHLVRRFVHRYIDCYNIINLDILTYAGNLENLKDIESFSNYVFERVDITKEEDIRKIFLRYNPDAVIHLAAESHVDKSIINPNDFVQTNVLGTINLLNLCKEFWLLNSKCRYDNFPKRNKIMNLFYYISTDEVYGSLLDRHGLFHETSPYNPRSPYAASKASADYFVRSYGNTYGLPFIISNCSNNYGPNHFPEKFIPLCILNILNRKILPVYGDGEYIRDWLFVIDHVIAIDKIFHEANIGEIYNIGAFNEWTNIDLVYKIIEQMDKKLGNKKDFSKFLITFTKDRPGHDRRYAVDATKLYKKLNWSPTVSFEEGLSYTIDWYLNNKDWVNNIMYKKGINNMFIK